MSDKTKIEWTDATWNVITGCSVVSAGCKHCYAMKLAGTRLQHHPSRAGLTIDTKAGPVWTGEVRFNEQWLTQPLCWSKPRRVFVCAHADLFHEAVPDEWIDRVFAVMAMAPQHTFQVLTKRPERMREYIVRRTAEMCSDDWFSAPMARAVFAQSKSACDPLPGNAPLVLAGRWPLPNVWIGVSVENQDAADERIPHLIKTPAAVRWVSLEPLLGPVSLKNCEHPNYSIPADYLSGMDSRSGDDQGTIDWVVVGGESGSNARPIHPQWARDLRDECAVTTTPFLFKQWGEWGPYDRGSADGAILATPGSLDTPMQRFGKKAAGRLLDGLQHDGYPEIFHD